MVFKLMATNQSLYDTDFYAWANEQAALLRAGKLAEADVQNIAEEIESMGKSEKQQLINRLTLLFLHLLKWRYQPGLRGNSWQRTIGEQRRKITRHLHKNPSLKPDLPDAIAEAYSDATYDAEGESGILVSSFPESCPWSFEQAMTPDWYPD